MDPKVEPQRKRKKKNRRARPPSSVSFSSLPHDLVVSCLARVSRSNYSSLSLVSKYFRSILSSRDIYAVRSQIGATEPFLYISLKTSRTDHRWFTLDQTLTTDVGEVKNRLVLTPIKSFSSDRHEAPSKSTTVAVGSEIYHFGKKCSVRVLDCRFHTWRRAPDMTVPRKYAKSVVSLDGKIYVLGGCGKTDDYMNYWGEVLDLKTQTWKPLPCPSIGLDLNHKVVVLKGRLYVYTMSNKYVYDPNKGIWKETTELGWGFCFCFCFVFGPRSWCVIENVMFNDHLGKYCWWGESSHGMVKGLRDLYMKRGRDYYTIQLVNHGGKLVIISHELIECSNNKRVWCAVIRLEKRFTNKGLEIFGEIEHLNVLHQGPTKSHKILTCLSVTL